MPLTTDPSETYLYTLERDRQAGRNRPAFRLRFLTCRQLRQYRKAFEAAPPDQTWEQELDALLEALRIVIAGWDGLTDPQGRELAWTEPATPAAAAVVSGALETALTPAQLWELYQAGYRQREVDEGDRKNLPSPSHTDAAASAATANPTGAPTGPATEDAETRRRPDAEKEQTEPANSGGATPPWYEANPG
jgi:hypothetical protein